MSLENLLRLAENPPQVQTFETVAQVMVTMAYQGFAGRDTQFFPFSTEDEETKAKSECQAFLNEMNTNPDHKNYPQRGILTTILGGDVPSHPEGKMKKDWEDFVGEYFSDNQAKQNLTDEELARVTGPLPYTVILNRLHKLSRTDLGSDKPTWAALTQEVDQYQRAKGKKRSYTDAQGDAKETDHRFFVVKQVFANRDEAVKYAYGLSSNAPATPAKLSQKAINSSWTIDTLNEVAGEMQKALANTPPIKVAQEYGIEVDDFKLLNVEIPF